MVDLGLWYHSSADPSGLFHFSSAGCGSPGCARAAKLHVPSEFYHLFVYQEVQERDRKDESIQDETRERRLSLTSLHFPHKKENLALWPFPLSRCFSFPLLHVLAATHLPLYPPAPCQPHGHPMSCLYFKSLTQAAQLCVSRPCAAASNCCQASPAMAPQPRSPPGLSSRALLLER